jgi:hypothetical protein
MLALIHPALARQSGLEIVRHDVAQARGRTRGRTR